MKRFIAALMLILLVAVAVMPAGAIKLGKAPSLLVMGDSISNGYGVELHQNYAYIVSNEIGSKYQNLSQDGLTSLGLVNKFKNNDYCDQVKDADLVMFTIGGNDLIAAFLKITSVYAGQSFTSVDAAASYLSKLTPAQLNEMMSAASAQTEMVSMLASFKSNLDSVFAKIKELNPEADIFVLTQYNPMSGVESLASLDKAADGIFVQLNTIMAESAAASGAYIIDIYENLKNVGGTYTNINAGDIHPNKDGHARMARAIVKYLENNILNQPEWTLPETTTLAPTEAPTDPAETTTESPANTEAPDKGCAGISVFAVIASAIAGVGVVIAKKK